MPSGYEPALANSIAEGGGSSAAASGAGLAGSTYFGIGLTAFQVWSAFQQAGLMRDRAALAARINEFNAKSIEYDAWEAEKFGYTQASRYDSVINQTISNQRLLFAAQNIDPDVGTAGAIQAESKLNGYLNRLELIEAGHKRAYGLKIQASNVRLGSEMSSIQSNIDTDATVRQGLIGAGLTGYQTYVNRGG